ncbi:MAG: hypothetical protein ACM3X5_02045 [Bacillota bacterium]
MLNVPIRPSTVVFLVALALAAAHARAESVKTICTITVNSSDEKETFRQNLPKDKYKFVELVEKGRSDWLRSSCEKHIQCDVLVISGHFNAGETFYSDKIGNNDFLQVDELERASCSESCPGIFSHLKEVYLFGCESLNPDPTEYSSAYGESGRDRMRRLFANVPAIYGFYSSAPVGPTAAMLLGRYFKSARPGEIFTGRPSPRLLSIFSHNHMTVTSGLAESHDRPGYRRDICHFYDERTSPAQKLDFVHALLKRDEHDVRGFFERVEKLLDTFTDDDRRSPEFGAALGDIARDAGAKERYLALERATRDASMRARMVAVARKLEWLSQDEHRAELVRLANDVLASPTMGFVEVDLLCSINKGRDLDAVVSQVKVPEPLAGRSAQVAGTACLGDQAAHERTVKALFSNDDRDVQVAQVYLRDRPMTDAELRTVSLAIARQASVGIQVRALETLARMHVTDRSILEELAKSFAAARSVGIQRAIAEIFLRAGVADLPRPELVALFKDHRIKSPDGREDLVDVLIKRLQAAS